jgi:hypothetical protein
MKRLDNGAWRRNSGLQIQADFRNPSSLYLADDFRFVIETFATSILMHIDADYLRSSPCHAMELSWDRSPRSQGKPREVIARLSRRKERG